VPPKASAVLPPFFRGRLRGLPRCRAPSSPGVSRETRAAEILASAYLSVGAGAPCSRSAVSWKMREVADPSHRGNEVAWARRANSSAFPGLPATGSESRTCVHSSLG
jgi:hypothetical protein